MSEAREVRRRGSRPERLKLSQRYWWLLIQAVCALIFGALAIWAPQMTIFLFLRLFGLYALIDGLIPISQVVISRLRTHARIKGEGMLIVEGGVGVIVGIFCLVLPRAQTTLLVYVIGAWLLLKGISLVTQARRRGWIVGLIGLLALAASIYLFINPTSGLHRVLILIGVFLLAMGVLLLVRGWRAWNSQKLPKLSEQV
jgi:uncharacterized membrane protein HdeD (DUF308 family)